ncbi:hypothetical protein SADUNF_Sadunf15G0003500 [Salix dunnii]|uniref:NADH-plastoquinone oxidoreductase subunit K n=1 Tax=Salix dunnii TaxID=1413687 RepID=A0A835JHH4_9ROSI|nr:hypothetical protein SADUNF_Sadunf15G0003500 [Salix dunnii]
MVNEAGKDSRSSCNEKLDRLSDYLDCIIHKTPSLKCAVQTDPNLVLISLSEHPTIFLPTAEVFETATRMFGYSIEFPLLDRTTPISVISTTSNDLSNWSRLSGLWPLLYGTSCCFIEFASLIGSRFDFDRYGLVPRSSPRQADLILAARTVTMKMAPSLVRPTHLTS